MTFLKEEEEEAGVFFCLILSLRDNVLALLPDREGASPRTGLEILNQWFLFCF